MKQSKLNDIQKAFKELEGLDAEILEIEKAVNHIANESGEAKISIKLRGVKEKKKKEKKEDGIGVIQYISMMSYATVATSDKWDTEIVVEPTPKMLLMVLGVLISEKQARRTKLIELLESCGIEL